MGFFLERTKTFLLILAIVSPTYRLDACCCVRGEATDAHAPPNSTRSCCQQKTTQSRSNAKCAHCRIRGSQTVAIEIPKSKCGCRSSLDRDAVVDVAQIQLITRVRYAAFDLPATVPVAYIESAAKRLRNSRASPEGLRLHAQCSVWLS